MKVIGWTFLTRPLSSFLKSLPPFTLVIVEPYLCHVSAFAANCQASRHHPPSSIHPPHTHNRLINWGRNSSSAPSRRSDILISFSVIVFLSHVSPSFLPAFGISANTAGRTDFSFFWGEGWEGGGVEDRRGARRGSVPTAINFSSMFNTPPDCLSVACLEPRGRDENPRNAGRARR